MTELSIADVGQKLANAGRLKLLPLCVYGSEIKPEGAVLTSAVDRCVAKAIFMKAADEKIPPICISPEDEGCCPAGRSWLGWGSMSPMIKYFVTTGHKDFRGGAAEHLKADPELFEESLKARGKITPPGKYIIIEACSAVKADPSVLSVLCFGSGEQVRNLAGLAHFNESEPFFVVLTPSGPSCATFVTYPAGMAENAPKRSVFTGPTDPTGNIWFPPDLMAMGIHIEKAREMAKSLDESFIGKRPKVAYPEHRLTR